MNIAVLSGKGGTGKTLVSVNLAAVAKRSTYIDCDVEEPNGHLFFRPEHVQEERVTVRIPVVDSRRCSGCRKCVEFCRFGALAYTQRGLHVFDDVCHSCGGCLLVCPEKALTEIEKPIGKIQRGVSQSVTCLTGMLNTGEASGVPIIQRLVHGIREMEGPVVIDCPPGSACNTMESIQAADYCILVAEPTLFGVHNLQMVYELVRLFEKPCGVVINKWLPGEDPVETFCLAQEITVLTRIPFSHALGLINSQGKIAVRADKKYEALFMELLDAVMQEVRCETVAYP